MARLSIHRLEIGKNPANHTTGLSVARFCGRISGHPNKLLQAVNAKENAFAFTMIRLIEKVLV
jgi:hypothetical protein